MPSPSHPSLSLIPSDMSERVARKAKTLFDAKEKVKHRFAAFESILGKIIGVNGLFMYLLELLPTIDGRTAFFKEHLHDLIAFALDSFYFFGEKLESIVRYHCHHPPTISSF